MALLLCQFRAVSGRGEASCEHGAAGKVPLLFKGKKRTFPAPIRPLEVGYCPSSRWKTSPKPSLRLKAKAFDDPDRCELVDLRVRAHLDQAQHSYARQWIGPSLSWMRTLRPGRSNMGLPCVAPGGTTPASPVCVAIIPYGAKRGGSRPSGQKGPRFNLTGFGLL